LLDRSTELFVPVTDAVALLGNRPLNDPDVDVVLVNRSYLRGITQVDRRTVDAARALLGIPSRED
jgi:RNase P/RNase MRP subunit POP5